MDAKFEAMSNADAHLNSAALPSYSEVTSVLSYLARQAALTDLPESNQARCMAADVLARIGFPAVQEPL